MMKIKFLSNSRGNITIPFLFFSGLLVGALNYSLFVGRSVQSKMDLQHNVDLASLSMASHSSYGLNMMATNNLAIGASMHISASSNFIGRYESIIKTLMYQYQNPTINTKQDFHNDHLTSFDETAKISSLYMKVAKNLSRINYNLGQEWIKGVANKGLEQIHLNMPGAVALPIQLDKDVGDLNFTFPFLKRSTGRNAMCQSLKSSQNMPNRDNYIEWLKAPLISLNLATDTLENLSILKDTATTMFFDFTSQIKVYLADHQAYYNSNCTNIKNNTPAATVIWCNTFSYWNNVSTTLPIIPKFEGCGLNDEGNLGDQIEHFAFNRPIIYDDGNGQPQYTFCHSVGNSNNVQTITTAQPGLMEGHLNSHPNDYVGNCKLRGTSEQEFEVGFIYPKVSSPQEVNEFSDSLNYSLAASLPTLSESEVSDSCPEAWRDSETGRCHHTVGGPDSIVEFSKYRDIWDRTMWALGQSTVYFDPGADDPQNGIPANNEDYQAYTASFFWPAWKSKMTGPTQTNKVIEYLKEK